MLIAEVIMEINDASKQIKCLKNVVSYNGAESLKLAPEILRSFYNKDYIDFFLGFNPKAKGLDQE